MATRGKKDCSNCNTEIGARSLLCDKCGYHYPSGKVRQDLLNKKLTPKEIVTYETGGRGRKSCSGCSAIVGAVTKICPKCQFDFSTIVKKKVTRKEKQEEPKKEGPTKSQLILKQEFLESQGKEVTDMSILDVRTPEEHAERILSYGKARATNLYLQHKSLSSCRWDFVNWKIVEEGLKLL